LKKPYRKLYGERLLIAPDRQKLSEVIVSPETMREPDSESGVIVDIGHTVSDEFEVGQRVAFHPGSVEEIKDGDGEALYLIGPMQVIAFLAAVEEDVGGSPL
jgi:hypothetical protein